MDKNMIFVTVGTHEQQFNRLLMAVDELKEKNIIIDDVVIQTGCNEYELKHCKCYKIIPYSKMIEYISEARIVVSHGGPASFLMSLQFGKIPIVVPRKREFGEHVNDHQVEFVNVIEKRYRNIIPVYDIEKLGSIIKQYESIIKSIDLKFLNNNKTFNENFEKIIKLLSVNNK